MKTLFEIVDVVGVVLEILIAISLFNNISYKKQIYKIKRLIINSICILVQSIVIIMFDNQILVSMMLFFILIGLSIQYKLSGLKRFLVCVLLMILFALSEIVIGLLLTTISNVSVEQLRCNILYYMQGVLISKLLMYVIIKIVGYFSVKSEVKVGKNIFLFLLALPLATFFVAYVMSIFMFECKPSAILAVSTIAIIFLIISNVLVFYLFEYQLKITENKKQEQMIKQQLENKLEYYKELSRRQNITNKTMHDLKNELFALREIYENDAKEGMDRINSICGNLLQECTLRFTGIDSVDAVITAKLQTINENNIKFNNSIYMPKEICIDVLDFCVLLGNLLDNAIEANLKVEISERYITLNIAQQLEYLSIIISNVVCKKIEMGEFGIISSKANKEIHGFGLQSIKEIAKKYNGQCSIIQEDNKFEVIVMLKN